MYGKVNCIYRYGTSTFTYLYINYKADTRKMYVILGLIVQDPMLLIFKFSESGHILSEDIQSDKPASAIKQMTDRQTDSFKCTELWYFLK